MAATNRIYPTPYGIARGLVEKHTALHKFGQAMVGTSYTPVAYGNNWQTPQAAGAVPLRVAAGGDAADTNGGAGAWSVIIVGVDANGVSMFDTLTLAGAAASDYSTVAFMRVVRVYVYESGTYATATASSHADEIVIEDADSNEWARLRHDTLGFGQSLIGVYTVPKGYTLYVNKLEVSTDANKPVDFLWIQRQEILRAAAPYTAMRLVEPFIGVSDALTAEYEPPRKFPELTDIGFMARAQAQTAEVSARMNGFLVETVE